MVDKSEDLDLSEIQLPYALAKNYFQKIADQRQAQSKDLKWATVLGVVIGLIIGGVIGAITFGIGAPIGYAIGVGICAGLLAGFYGGQWWHNSNTFNYKDIQDKAYIEFNPSDLTTSTLSISKAFTLSKIKQNNGEYTLFMVNPSSSDDKEIREAKMKKVIIDIVTSEVTNLKEKQSQLQSRKNQQSIDELNHCEQQLSILIPILEKLTGISDLVEPHAAVFPTNTNKNLSSMRALDKVTSQASNTFSSKSKR